MLQKTINLLKQEAANKQEASNNDIKALQKRIKEREKKVQQLETRVLDLEEEKIHVVEEFNEKIASQKAIADYQLGDARKRNLEQEETIM